MESPLYEIRITPNETCGAVEAEQAIDRNTADVDGGFAGGGGHGHHARPSEEMGHQ